MQSPLRKRPRPNEPQPHTQAEQFDLVSDEDEDDDEREDEPEVLNFTEILKKPPKYDKEGNPILLAVDVTGLHYITVHSCSCLHDVSMPDRLLQATLYPASHQKPRTVFTFDALSDFLLQNRECDTSISNYYSKLRRMTNDEFAHLLPVSERKYLSVFVAYANLESREGTQSGVPSMAKFTRSCLARLWAPDGCRAWTR